MSTAIAIVWTEHGFGIAADGLDCEAGSKKIRSECAQKIFQITSPNKQLAYAISGIIGFTKPDSDEVLFHFTDRIPEALNSLAQASEPSLYDFAHALGKRLSNHWQRQ